LPPPGRGSVRARRVFLKIRPFILFQGRGGEKGGGRKGHPLPMTKGRNRRGESTTLFRSSRGSRKRGESPLSLKKRRLLLPHRGEKRGWKDSGRPHHKRLSGVKSPRLLHAKKKRRGSRHCPWGGKEKKERGKKEKGFWSPGTRVGLAGEGTAPFKEGREKKGKKEEPP